MKIVSLYKINNSISFIIKLFWLCYISIFIKFYEYNERDSKINCNFINNINEIRLGIVSPSLKNGGIERQTSLILNYFSKLKIFSLILFTKKKKEKKEYLIDKNIKRIILDNNLIDYLIIEKIDILIYQFYDYKEINSLNKLKNIKIIIFNRSCFLHWIYYNDYDKFKNYYHSIKNCKYIISLVPFENDYLLKKWGIDSILMTNFLTYDFNSVIPSTLSSKIILMIGRADDKIKRFDLGIKAMNYIIKEIIDCRMKIISKNDNLYYLKNLTNTLKINNFIQFVGYTSKPEIFFKNASLHLFPTLVESFGNVLTETLTYGIPNILVGLDYVSAAKGGTIIIYDDSPVSLANIAIKILKNSRLKKKIGKEARKSMKKYRNDLLLKRWANLIFSIYKGYNYYKALQNKDKVLHINEARKILENQIILLKKRKKELVNITIYNIENLTFMENLK